MGKAEFKRLVKKHGGWLEGDIARFPSPHMKSKFLAEASYIEGEKNVAEHEGASK